MKCPDCGEEMNFIDLSPDQFFTCKCGAVYSIGYVNGFWAGYNKAKEEIGK